MNIYAICPECTRKALVLDNRFSRHEKPAPSRGTCAGRLHGGYLPNSYMGGESDRVQIETDAQGRTTYHVSRTYAEHTAHGRGDTLRTWTVTAGGAMKRAA